MTVGLIGTKLGMTREFIQSGQSVPVTVIKIETGRVIDIIEKEKRGYSAIKIGYFKTKNSKLSKQMKGFFTKFLRFAKFLRFGPAMRSDRKVARGNQRKHRKT